MFNWLDTIRTQSLSRRRFVAFLITLFFTGVLFVVWLTIWLPRFKQEIVITEKNKEFTTPKDNLAQSISSTWIGVTKNFNKLKDTVKNFDFTEKLTTDTNYPLTGTTSSAEQAGVTIVEVSSTTTDEI